MQKQILNIFDRNTVQSVLKYTTLKYLYYNIFILLFTLFQYGYLQLPVPFSLSIVVELICWYYYARFNIIKSIDSMLRLLSYIYVIIASYLEPQYYIAINIFIVLGFLIRIKWNCKTQAEHEYSTILQFLKTFYRFSNLIATVCITLKLSDFVSWTWPQAFWWYWMFLSALLGSSFTLLMIILSKAINEFCADQLNERGDYKPMLWSFYVSLMSSLMASFWIINTFDLIGLDVPLNIGLKGFIVLCICNIFFFSVFTKLLFPQLVEFVLQMNNLDADQIEISQDKTKKENLKVVMFLKRLSSAYYKEVNQIEVENKKQTINQNEIFTERNASNKMITILPTVPEKGSLQQKDPNISNTKCIICCERSPDAVLMPCGHGGVCYQCSTEMAQKNRECFLCRLQITEILEIEQNTANQYLKVLSKTKVI